MLFSDTAAKQPAADTRNVEVLGRVENLYVYEPTNHPDDLLGHGRMTAKFYVARVLRGPRLPPVVTVQYFGHTFIKNGRMRLKLRRDGDIYLVCAPTGSVGFQCP